MAAPNILFVIIYPIPLVIACPWLAV